MCFNGGDRNFNIFNYQSSHVIDWLQDKDKSIPVHNDNFIYDRNLFPDNLMGIYSGNHFNAWSESIGLRLEKTRKR